MKIIAIISQKGGSGKTSLALHLAVVSAQTGFNTAIIDLGACAAEINLLRKRRIGPYFPDFSANRATMHLKIVKIWPRFSTFSLRSFLPRRLLDPQASAAIWSDRRSTEFPVVLSAHASRLSREITRVKETGGDILYLDTAPHSDSVALRVAEAADLVLIPCRTAILDLKPLRTHSIFWGPPEHQYVWCSMRWLHWGRTPVRPPRPLLTLAFKSVLCASVIV